MKKSLPYLLCVLLLILGSSLAFAADKGGFVSQTPAPAASGGFSGPGVAPVTVKDAATMRDDAYVVLRGAITQHLGKDKYLFQDATGTIRIEIDHDKWSGQTVTPSDTVEIHGEVDKDWNSVEIDVDRIVKL
ncbi:Protein YgiW [uncultured delta proteobacterium]|uniref:Protein YgiW n=1 Tax=uncultured delta proteobacterium TaxID=34034 RepID=A0A212KB47_9DELT|nr:Protein YgiW [uncultured delta proteobacterium]